MRIAILAPGSRGDIQPYVALGLGLQRAGHDARIVTTRDHASLVTAHGLPLHSADLDVQAELRDAKTSAAVESGKLLASFRRFADIAQRGARLIGEQALAAADGADLIVTGFTGLLLGASLSEKMGIPLTQAYNVPLTPTRAFPGVLFPRLSFPPRTLTHAASHWLGHQVLWMTMLPTARQVRGDLLGLGPAPMFAPFDRAPLRDGQIIYGFSPHVLPAPTDWDPRIRITGTWSLDEAAGWTPPVALLDFLSRGPQPVYIGFGSMNSREPARTAALVLDALRATGQRAVINAGWGGLELGDLPDTVALVDGMPHAWLFQHVRAVVHHGGAGTTAAGIRAGVPSIVVPFHGDQPFWARTIEHLGIGPAGIPRRKLTAERLARAIGEAVGNQEMRTRAARLGERVRDEDGVGAAVRAIEVRHAH